MAPCKHGSVKRAVVEGFVCNFLFFSCSHAGMIGANGSPRGCEWLLGIFDRCLSLVEFLRFLGTVCRANAKCNRNVGARQGKARQGRAQ